MRLPTTKKTSAKLRSENGDIIYGMAKGPWALEWANVEEERGRSFSGQDIYAICPEPPKVAIDWAHKVAQKILGLNSSLITAQNQHLFPLTLMKLYHMAQNDGFTGTEEEFGMKLGCQSCGHGIAWDDDISPNNSLKIEVPYDEFYI